MQQDDWPTLSPTPSASTGLPVVETFHSIQGEGCHVGRSAVFIRLAGCRVGCSWCDTRHSWSFQAHPQRPITELVQVVEAAVEAGAGFAVITGGEPLHHDLDPLCSALATVHRPLQHGGGPLPLHLETSGVDRLSGRFDWITLSPKRHRPPTAELLAACHELKVVVSDPDDLAFADRMAAAAQEQRPGMTPRLLLQPCWESSRGRELTLGHVVAHPQWRLSLQTHKWLGVR
ncbi:MAG: 7-carboxy-7-deazaguanine synthase QueE [Cyanobacteriota bacterium]